MRTLVKAVAVSSVMAITFVQPGADAALAPERTIELSRELPPVPVAEIGELSELSEPGVAPLLPVIDILSNAAAVEFPKVSALDPKAWSISIPTLNDASLSLYGAVPMSEQPKAPVASKPEPAKPQAAIAPNDGAIAPTARSPKIDMPLPSVRPSRPTARLDQIQFAGPAGTPFAHIRFCMKYPDECREDKAAVQDGLLSLTEERRRELQHVNLDVNRAIVATPAVGETAATEKWVISPERGDCNDYAVTKRSKLIAMGWPARALLLAEVIVPSGEGHLVVVVRTDKGDMVLDNLNANIRLWSKTGYQWVRVESPENPQFWSKVAPVAATVASIGTSNGRF